MKSRRGRKSVHRRVLGRSVSARRLSRRSNPPDPRALLDFTSEGIVALDRDGVVRYANAQALALLAVDRRELLDQPLLSALPAVEGSCLAEAWRAAEHGMLPVTAEGALTLPARGVHVA